VRTFDINSDVNAVTSFTEQIEMRDGLISLAADYPTAYSWIQIVVMVLSK
jgi:hypothetical protein